MRYRDLRRAGQESWRYGEGAQPYGGRRLIVDTSAWAAIDRADKLNNVPKEWSEALRRGQLLMSPIVRLELLHHAKSGVLLNSWDQAYDSLREVPVKKGVVATALDAVRDLAAKGGGGYHRVDLGDLLIAASAQEANVGVLHYNARDFDKLATVLTFDSMSLGPPGTFERKG